MKFFLFLRYLFRRSHCDRFVIAMMLAACSSIWATTFYCPYSFDATCTGGVGVSICTLSNVTGERPFIEYIDTVGPSHHGQADGKHLDLQFTDTYIDQPMPHFPTGLITCSYSNSQGLFVLQIQASPTSPHASGPNWQQVPNEEYCYNSDPLECAYSDS
jgi:hypothetical protein